MKISQPTRKQERSWKKFVSSFPANVRAVAERFDPWTLYRLETTGHRVLFMGLDENQDGTVTVTVAVLGQFNSILFEREVFGIDPDDLTECDLPEEGETMGAMIPSDHIENNRDALRVMIRPDLWAMDEDGKAVRKN